VQLLIFNLPNTKDILKILVKNGDLSEEAENKIFDAPNAVELLRIMIKEEQELYTSSEFKMLRLPDFAELMEEYTEYCDLSEDAQMELFKLPNAKDVVIMYHKKKFLCEEALALAQAKEWL